MSVSEKVVINLEKAKRTEGEYFPFLGEFLPDVNILPYPEAEFTAPVAFDGEYSFDGENVSVEGEITVYLKGICDRCCSSLEFSLTVPFCQIFYSSFDEEREYIFTDNTADITKALTDEIIMSLPTSLLCKQDCAGLCPKCGKNLNEGSCGCDLSEENAFSVLKNLKI